MMHLSRKRLLHSAARRKFQSYGWAASSATNHVFGGQPIPKTDSTDERIKIPSISIVSNNTQKMRNAHIFTMGLSHRYFSSNSNSTTSCDNESCDAFYNSTSEASDSSVEETIANLSGSESAITATSAGDASAAVAEFTPTWYNPVDQVVTLLNYIDSLHDLPYAYTIIGSTFALRTVLLPIFINGQRNSSRLAHMTPELNVLKSRIEKLGKNVDTATQAKYGEEMRALFRKYNCNPLKGLVPPLVQMPIFMSMFFALRKMPDLFQETFSNGGIFWFPDLTSPDPLYILPVASAATFIATIELSKNTIESTSSASQATIMTNVFRGLGIIMIPLTASFPSAVLSYWVMNNLYSMLQSLAFQQKPIRKALGIWEPPKKIAGAPEPKGIQETISDMIKSRSEKGSDEEKREKMKKHNEEVEHKKLEQKVRAASIGSSVSVGKRGKKRKGRGKR